ncbi:hypothetical protein KCU93_g9262, partial [Aureobasidium melanogenum]
MAAAQVLSSPELLSLILECLGEQNDESDQLEDCENCSNRFTLAAAARVNSVWFETAIRTLWSFERWGPGLEHMNKIETERRHIYTSKLTSIKIRDKFGQKPSITALSFPRRRALHVGRVGCESGPSPALIKQYLCPSIVSIAFWDWYTDFNVDILNAIRSECPRLRSFELDVINIHDGNVTPEDFNDFFRTRTLESLKISIGWPLMDKDLFLILGRVETLKKLSITSYLYRQQIPDFVFDEATSFFKNLQQVDLMLEGKAVKSATKAIRYASKVKLQIRTRKSRRTTMFSNLKYMKNCRDLTLIFEGENIYLNEEDLCNLNTLKRLEFLVLMPVEEEDTDDVNLVHFRDASDFEAAFAGLQRLHSLNWQLSGMDLTVQTLNRLSRNHRFRNIFFRGSWDLLGLTEVEGCLFPNLRNLTLGRNVIPGHKGRVPYKQIAENLLRHAPKLESLSFTHERNTRVVDSWKKLKREKAARSRSQESSDDDDMASDGSTSSEEELN